MSEIKYPESIFSVTRDFVERTLGLSQGFNTHVGYDRFCELLPGALRLARREETETDENLVQLLPYMTFVKLDPSGNPTLMKCFTYQRTKLTGEGRLAGKYSVGAGGHVEARDGLLMNAETGAIEVLQPARMLSRNKFREMTEELEFSQGGQPVGDLKLDAVFSGLIYDPEDTSTKRVGYFHLGINYVVFVPEDLEIEMRESDNVAVGWKTSAELQVLDMENWTRIVACKEIAEASLAVAYRAPVFHHAV